MGIFNWIILGAVAGWIGSLLMGVRTGPATCIVVGMIGAVIGGFVFNRFGEPAVTGLNLWSIWVALAGSVLMLAFFRAIRGPQVH